MTHEHGIKLAKIVRELAIGGTSAAKAFGKVQDLIEEMESQLPIPAPPQEPEYVEAVRGISPEQFQRLVDKLWLQGKPHGAAIALAHELLTILDLVIVP